LALKILARDDERRPHRIRSTSARCSKRPPPPISRRRRRTHSGSQTS
jgi:hypothetical protein